MQRRTFLATASASAAQSRPAATSRPPADFRYAPLQGQATFCLPDDPHKSLVGEHGDLRYGFDRRQGIHYFPFIVEFTLRGMEPDRVHAQRLESPAVPVVRTRLERPEAFIDLTCYATQFPAEGRVDNVLLEVTPRSGGRRIVAPMLRVRTRRTLKIQVEAGRSFVTAGDAVSPFLLADCPLRLAEQGDGYALYAPEAFASAQSPVRRFFRFPLAGQPAATVEPGLTRHPELLESALSFWRTWQPFQSGVGFQLPRIYQDFLTACTRNILQARELIQGKLTFQVGATTYRGLWVVDGNFILEAARYLGYHDEARQGLKTTWDMQRPDGSVVAAVETAHWKDTAIAMFSLVRQAELGQDWAYFRAKQRDILRGVAFLGQLRQQARDEGSVNGRYGLLARGFGDGGIGGGLRDEFTNTLWALAGLRAVSDAAAREQIAGFEPAAQLYQDLRAAFFEAARHQMRLHPQGFEFLPMILKEDPAWSHPDELSRPPLQQGQWALAQALYPGLVFEPSHPVVRGYVNLMRACVREDVPAGTGWLPHDGLWNYEAGFAAHACLWAGASRFALDTFRGFLNHATPLFCWREEQPVRGALTGGYVGDMPHNWASAECVLFLRHMLALEDGSALRLLEGIDQAELAPREPFAVTKSPSRFGCLTLHLSPERGSWILHFQRDRGPAPASVRLPAKLGSHQLAAVKGAGSRRTGSQIEIDPAASDWTALWRA